VGPRLRLRGGEQSLQWPYLIGEMYEKAGASPLLTDSLPVYAPGYFIGVPRKIASESTQSVDGGSLSPGEGFCSPQ
jgi:hypothetical protein